jgi:hypothetical protein
VRPTKDVDAITEVGSLIHILPTGR